MKIISLITVVLISAGTLFAEGEKKLSREEIRSQLQNLSPEEREAKIKELRGSKGPRGRMDTSNLPPEKRAQMEKMMEGMKGLSPDERRKKMQEFREKGMSRPDGAKAPKAGMQQLSAEERNKLRQELQSLSPEERQKRIHEMREKFQGSNKNNPQFDADRINKYRELLEKKEKEGTLSDAEKQRLERIRNFANKKERITLELH